MLLSTSAADFLARISAKVVDGTVILMAVLGSLSYSFPNNIAIMATIFVTLLAVALAHAYAETINCVMKECRMVPWPEMLPVWLKQTWVMVGAILPITFFGLAAVGFITQDKAFRLTEIALILVLFFFGFLSRRLVGGGILRSILYGGGAVLLGLILVEIKLLAKYLPDIGQ
ncbi:MAG: hypothetical protein JSU59_00980 [Nitrospirota bacterium]|nr:MAG: hypothetical protein JSU59_00980 [Nitrospirota bacterium]